MDLEIRQEYMKLYPPVKELFNLLDKGNPNIYKQMHVYLEAADKAKVLISLLRLQKSRAQFEVDREAVEKLLASAELHYSCFNRNAAEYLQMVKDAKEQKSTSTARLREYRERARAELYAVDFWIRVSWLSKLVLNRDYLKYYDYRLGNFCWRDTPKNECEYFLSEKKQRGEYTLYNYPFWSMGVPYDSGYEALYEQVRPLTMEEFEKGMQEVLYELERLNSLLV